jgi:hypothetical protein
MRPLLLVRMTASDGHHNKHAGLEQRLCRSLRTCQARLSHHAGVRQARHHSLRHRPRVLGSAGLRAKSGARAAVSSAGAYGRAASLAAAGGQRRVA